MAGMAATGPGMSGNPYLDWAILAVSLFNAILLAWLGLTVLLNSDRRRWGIWIAGGGMLLGAAFFTSHTALIALGLINLGWDTLIFWWSIGLLSAITLPFLWYIIMLWYAGYWEDKQSELHRRQRPWFILTAVLLLLGVVGIISATISLGIGSPRFGRWFIYLRFSDSGIPLMVLGFSFYMLLSIALSLDALRRPGPSARVMGQLARRRARPWLAGASVALFFVAVIVTAALFWIGQLSRDLLLSEVYQRTASPLAFLDLVVSLLIGVVILFLGQAIVSYEVFTGKTLPRRGLHRQWQRTLLFAGATSVLVGGALTLAIQPIYALLLAVLLMTFFYALVSWRSYVERERLMENLRPFVASQGLYDHLLTSNAPADFVEAPIEAPFYALCRDVLDTHRAYLIACGPLASLIDKALVYPPLATRRSSPATPNIQPILNQFDHAGTDPLAVDPASYGGSQWAIPLWGEKGLSGVLLLGEKRGGGLYAKEEMEIAAITGERLIDTQAGAEMSRRLMQLQRSHMARTQVVDQQTRRVLHDEILPDLHAAMISLSGSKENGAGNDEELMALLAGTHRQISDLLHQLPPTTAPEVERLGLLPALKRTVQQDYAAAFDSVQWQIGTAVSEHLNKLPPVSAGVIYYAAREAVRNAARYGRALDGTQPFDLTIAAHVVDGQDGVLSTSDEVQIIIEDNGQGFPAEKPPSQNGGQGLALHSTMMAIIGGSLTIDSVPADHTRITLTFPSIEEVKDADES